MIEEFPEDITISDIMAELYFRQNVDDGLKEPDEAKVVSPGEAKKRLNRWLEFTLFISQRSYTTPHV